MRKPIQSLLRFLAGAARLVVFWGLFVLATHGAFRALAVYWPEMSAEQLQAAITSAPTPFSVFRDKNFAIGLAGLIAATAAGFWATYLISAALVRLSLEWNRRWIARSQDEAAF